MRHKWKITLTAAKTHAGESMGELPVNKPVRCSHHALGARKARPVPALLSGDRVRTERNRTGLTSAWGGKQQAAGDSWRRRGWGWKAVQQWWWSRECFSDSMAWKRTKDSGLFGRRLLALSFRDLILIWDLNCAIWTYQWLFSVIRAPDTLLDAVHTRRPHSEHLNTDFSTVLDGGHSNKYKC